MVWNLSLIRYERSKGFTHCDHTVKWRWKPLHYAKVLVSEAAQVRKGETVCILADEAIQSQLTESLIEASEDAGAETHLLKVKSRDLESNTTLDAISKYSVIFVLTGNHAVLSVVSKDKALAAGARMLEFAHASVDVATETIPIDHEKISRDAERVIEIITKGKEIHITSPRGSDLTFSTYGQVASCGYGRTGFAANRAGAYMEIPYGSVHAPPVEDFGDGSLVIDTTTWLFGRISEPFKLVVKGGRLTEVVGEGREATWLRNVLKEPFQYVNRLAEFIVGLNPNATHDRYMPEGEKVRGSIGMDVGYESGIADMQIGKHTDIGSARNPTVTVDGETLIENGRLLI